MAAKQEGKVFIGGLSWETTGASAWGRRCRRSAAGVLRCSAQGCAAVPPNTAACLPLSPVSNSVKPTKFYAHAQRSTCEGALAPEPPPAHHLHVSPPSCAPAPQIKSSEPTLKTMARCRWVAGVAETNRVGASELQDPRCARGVGLPCVALRPLAPLHRPHVRAALPSCPSVCRAGGVCVLRQAHRPAARLWLCCFRRPHYSRQGGLGPLGGHQSWGAQRAG